MHSILYHLIKIFLITQICLIPLSLSLRQFLPGGTVCRDSTDECDLPEYCNGSFALCQPDVFKQNGHMCRGGVAYCYNGLCQRYDSQCQALFGSSEYNTLRREVPPTRIQYILKRT